MIYHRGLNITEEIVKSELDIIQLIEWRLFLENEIVDIKKTISSIPSESIPNSLFTARLYRIQLLNIVNSRIKEVKALNGKEVLLMRKFMNVAKEILGKSEYQKILEEAKKLAKY